MFKRWKKIEEDFFQDDGSFDISKLPDICDNIKYDIIHNPYLRDLDTRKRVLDLSILLCMITVPFEYGVNKI